MQNLKQETEQKQETTCENEYDIGDIIHVMDVYRAEGEHRETILWRQNFKFFYASLITTFLPNLSQRFELGVLSGLPQIVFPICGLLLAFVFLFVSLGCIARLNMINNTYKKVIALLPKAFERESNANIKFCEFLTKPMALPVSIVMFVALLLVSLTSIVLLLLQSFCS